MAVKEFQVYLPYHSEEGILFPIGEGVAGLKIVDVGIAQVPVRGLMLVLTLKDTPEGAFEKSQGKK